MIRKPLALRWRAALALLSTILLVAGYLWLAHRQKVKNPQDTTMPTVTQLAEGVEKIVTPHKRSGEVWLIEDAKATGMRLALGLLVGILSAVLLGFIMGTWSPGEAFLTPPITILGKLNPIAMLAVFFVLVGTDTEMFVAMIAFGILPSLAMTVYLSAKHDVPAELIHKSYTLGASHFEVIWHVVGHSVLPKIIEGIRLQIGPALVYLIAAEMVVGDVGFGYRIRLQSRLLHMNVVYPYIAILALFGYGLDFGLLKLLHWSCPWYTKSTEEEERSKGVLASFWRMLRGQGGDEA